jgi:two-component system, OmpR family, alkaline phosphatase synthesis response regulator PhoP
MWFFMFKPEEHEMTIYYMEDDASERELVVYALGKFGFDASGFFDSDTFLAECRKNPPDLILLDLLQQNEDGLSILQKVKKDVATQYVPVILITMCESEYNKVMGFGMGADAYLTKPIGIMELISRINAILRRAQPK